MPTSNHGLHGGQARYKTSKITVKISSYFSFVGSTSESEVNPFHKEARDYLNAHKVPELFETLTALLVYNRPDDPKEFIKTHIKKLKETRDNGDSSTLPLFFDESNVTSIFGMLDVSGRGHITLEQYKQAMATLGITKYNVYPIGGELDRISREVFVREASSGLQKHYQTFSDE